MQQVGPLTWAELYARAQAGQLGPADLIWDAQLSQWLPAAQIPGLLPLGPQSVVAQQPPWVPAAQPRTRKSILPWLIPLIALIVVGAGLGTYFGFFYDRDKGVVAGGGASGGGGSGSTVTTGAASTDGGRDGDSAAIENKLPDPSRLAETAAWGKVPVNQICVVLAEGTSRDDAEELAGILDGTVVGAIEVVNAYQIETSGSTEADLQAAIDTARAHSNVMLAAPNQPISPAAEGEIWGKRISPLDDPAYAGAKGEGYSLIGVQTAWDYIRGSGLDLNPVQVGVVDTGMYAGNGQFDGGVNISYTDSAAQLANPESITYSDGSTAGDPAGGHGTGVNTIIGADADDGGPAGIGSILGNLLTISNTNNHSPPYGYGYAPTAPDPNDPSKVEWGDGNTYSFDNLAAIMAQVNAGSKVINLSWGPDDYTKVDPETVGIYRQFFERLARTKPDVVFVAAAGNNGVAMKGDSYYPAGLNIPNLITVGNLDNDGSMFKESNTATETFEVTLSAPGEQSVRGYDPATGQVTSSRGGSSMAAPQVAAAAALLKSLNPDLDASQIKDILRVTARKNAAGDPVLAVDEAVFEVINMTREINGQQPLTRDDMRNQGVIDAVATPIVGEENEYVVRGIVQSLDESKGVDVNIVLSSGEILEGDDPRHMTSAGEVGWLVRMDDDKGTITVYRQDNKAGSRITLEKFDVNGHWEGTLTFTSADMSDEAAAELGGEGCSLGIEEMAAFLRGMQGRAFPMTLDITVDREGKGTAALLIDMSALVAEIAARYEDVNISANTEPQTVPVTYKGNTLTFGLKESAEMAGRMEGTVSKQGDALMIKGVLDADGGAGFAFAAVWTVTKPY